MEWYAQLKINTLKPTNVVISLLDENGSAALTWNLLNAWIVSFMNREDIESNTNIFESIELASEQMSLVNP